MEVKVLGVGCPKCSKLFELTERSIREAGVEADLEKLERLDEIMAYGVLMVPALVVDGDVKCAGKVPSADEVVGWLREAAQ